MTERENVIKGLELCLTPIDRREYGDAEVCHPECPYFSTYNMGDCIRALAKDALALLKAQEPIKARLHLCDSCTKLYPECDATTDGIKFGCGFGNDNIIGCTAYENRWKAQEPRVMTISMVLNLKESTPVWLEDVDKKNIMGALFMRNYTGTKCVDFAIVRDWEFERVVADYIDYGVRWRCWTSRPTDEQREATPWERLN